MSSKSKQRNKQETRNTVSVSFTSEGWEDYNHWCKNDDDIFEKLSSLLEECLRTPFKGTGKPEPLKGDLSGFWSRRITKEHRLVYLYEGGTLTVLQCRFHYDD